MRYLKYAAAITLALQVSACATPAPQATVVSGATRSAASVVMAPTVPTLKRKIAVGRFSNATNYGRALLIDPAKDPLADQAADMLMARLTESGKFLVFEREGIEGVRQEQALTPGQGAQLVGVDTLIFGSVTQFGRKTEGQVGFLSSTLKQTVEATVEIRLVDVRTGRSFFSTSGTGSAAVEAGEVAGFGSRAAYDASLNDKAISAAISDLITNVIQKLSERRWSTDILDATPAQVMISGGRAQGLKVGDRFNVEQPGRTVVSAQSGLPITLPGTVVGQIEIVSFFGEGEAEGSVARVVSGSITPATAKTLVVTEAGP